MIPNVLSLFTGAGGLDLGLEAAGFRTRLCVECDPVALDTLAYNRPNWSLSEDRDVVSFSKDPHPSLLKAGLGAKDVDVLAGGPPCQPFSKAAFWTKSGPRRMRDPRAYRTLHAYLRVVEKLKPRVLLLENVSAFASQTRNEGYRTIRAGLAAINRRSGTNYIPHLFQINAADYGVPQLRERVLMLAAVNGGQFQMPAATHGPKSASAQPFTTAWDALGGDSPREHNLEVSGRWGDLLASIPEGNNYSWHTPRGRGIPLFGWRTRYWNFLLKLARNRPSWTISASPGPASGPFHWDNRLLSIEELLRLQTFPDEFKVLGNRRAAQRQIGNAVPPALAEVVGLAIRAQLFGAKNADRAASLVPARRSPSTVRLRRSRVPARYLPLAGAHPEHPGVGRGPGRIKASRKGASINSPVPRKRSGPVR
jgi:DNA (cytosine-5)-methyltransferase 1